MRSTSPEESSSLERVEARPSHLVHLSTVYLKNLIKPCFQFLFCYLIYITRNKRMNKSDIKLTQRQARKIIDDMPWITDESYKAMSDEKRDAFHIVLAETFLKSNYKCRQEVVDIGIDHLYSKYSHADMYERDFIEPNCRTDEEEEMFERGDYDDMPTECWEFIHDMVIDRACEDLEIHDVDLDDEIVYYTEADAYDDEIFEYSMDRALEAFKSQSFAMDLDCKLEPKSNHTKQLKI